MKLAIYFYIMKMQLPWEGLLYYQVNIVSSCFTVFNSVWSSERCAWQFYVGVPCVVCFINIKMDRQLQTDVADAFRNNSHLQQFMLTGVTPTGRRLGTGSYGSVEEVSFFGFFFLLLYSIMLKSDTKE